jgi:serine/threonine-protein kinase
VADEVAEGVRVLAGRYELGERIGHGGMADVFVGTDRRLGRRVAIKLLRSNLAEDPSFRSRFRREAHDAAKMAHPTIVRIYDAGEESVVDAAGTERLVPFIVMEYVDGRLLRDVVEEGPVAPAEAARIVEQVLTALEYSHRAGVIHRDIKPGNIMIARNGQVKVMDFGIARAISDSSATLAETSAVIGTAQYFSPEQARGESVDARTDLYSTGVVLFELLTGRAPFRGDSPVAVAYQHVNAEPAAPSTLVPAISPAVDAVVLRSLVKDRFERFQSAAEFRTALQAAVSGEVPGRAAIAPTEFNATLFGVNPTAVAGSEVAMRQLSAEVDERATRTQNRPPVAWIWVGIISMIAIIAAVVYWIFTLQPANFEDTVAVQVPDVIGQNYDSAADLLEGMNLVPQRFEETHETIAQGLVISTDPAAGTSVAHEQIVRVTVSAGPTKVNVPDVARLDEASARATLEGAGLVVGTVTASDSPDVPAGAVMGTDPAANVAGGVPKGSTVNLLVSNGQVTVPDLTGQPLQAASSTLQSLGLTAKTQLDPGCSGGAVAAQSVMGAVAQRSEVQIRACVP